MKKCIIALAALFIISAAFGGCRKNGEQNGQESQSGTTASAQTDETSVTADDDTDEQVSTDGTESKDSAEEANEKDEKEEKKTPEPKGLKANTDEQNRELAEKLAALKDENGNYIFDKSVDEPHIRSIVSEDEISVGDFYAAELYRESANLVCTDLDSETNIEDFEAAANSTEKSRRANELTDSKISESDVTVKLKINGTLPPEIVSVTQSYSITDLTLTGFVCRNKDNTFDIIVDPAYMYNIPMPLSCNTKYSLNGETVLMDSVSFTAQKGRHAEETKDISGDYVYARMNVGKLTVSYDSEGNNYSYADIISDIKIISEDIPYTLNNSFGAAKFEDKGAGEAAATYKMLLDNIDMFMAEDVVGVNLIDLDVDGTPELLVSKQVLPENADPDSRVIEQCDVAVYSIKSGKPVYIDTLYNSKSNVYYNGNVIGLKTTEKLEKKWFCMSRRNIGTGKFSTDGDYNYLVSLENGKLNYTEVFSSKPSVIDPETGDTAYDYYFYGEKIVPTVTLGPRLYGDDEENAPDDREYYSWNGITSNFGIWELYGFIQAEYCSDITPVYDLYSDWLYSSSNYNDIGKKLTIGERTMKYKLAYLTDAYYYGEYDSEESGYTYQFLGDYAKPVIYLYPEEKTDVSVKLDLDGAITCAYPDYRNGWEVTAYPDGTIIDKYDGEEYYCLYWEGKGAADWDMSKGFVVKSGDTANFLKSKLKEIGLTPRESNEFIIYWLPELQKNECNFITFQTEAYEKNAGLEISPAPDSMLRVFMVYEPCSEDFSAEPQEFEPFERSGFTVVEWGGQKK